jgi:hypothetical protein
MLGGFITAMQAFSYEMGKSHLSSFVMGSKRFNFFTEEHSNFSILALSDAKSDDDHIMDLLKLIYKKFKADFDDEVQYFKGNVKIFENFEIPMNYLV